MLTQTLLNMALGSTEWIIYFLVLASFVSIAIIVDRFFVLRAKKNELDRLMKSVHDIVHKDKEGDIEKILAKHPSSAATVALNVIKNMKDLGIGFEEALPVSLSEERITLERRMAVLGTLASNAPYIGLFGTVLGIINAFHNLSTNVKGGPAVIMKGISEALIATALGLLVAIPAACAYNYFVRYIRKLVVGSENFTKMVVIPYMKKVKRGTHG